MEVEVSKKNIYFFVEVSCKHNQAGASFKLIELVRHGLVKALSWLLIQISNLASVSSETSSCIRSRRNYSCSSLHTDEIYLRYC